MLSDISNELVYEVSKCLECFNKKFENRVDVQVNSNSIDVTLSTKAFTAMDKLTVSVDNLCNKKRLTYIFMQTVWI